MRDPHGHHDARHERVRVPRGAAQRPEAGVDSPDRGDGGRTREGEGAAARKRRVPPEAALAPRTPERDQAVLPAGGLANLRRVDEAVPALSGEAPPPVDRVAATNI